MMSRRSYEEHAAARRAKWSPEAQELAAKARDYFKAQLAELKQKLTEPLPDEE